jgi:predicted ATP-grasp superfamily ATP-dependent carboligase
MLVKLANNQEIAPATPKIGTTWVYLIRDFMAAVRLMLRGDISITDYLAPLKRARCWATFSLNDPLPGLADIPLTAWRVLTRRMFHLG